MYAQMYVCMHACMHVCVNVHMHVCVNVCMHVSVCMYVCCVCEHARARERACAQDGVLSLNTLTSFVQVLEDADAQARICRERIMVLDGDRLIVRDDAHFSSLHKCLLLTLEYVPTLLLFCWLQHPFL